MGANGSMVNQVRRAQMTLTEAIYRRQSVRSFNGQPLETEHMMMLRGTARNVPRLSDAPIRFVFWEGTEKANEILQGIVGNYGKVKDAPLMIVGIVGKDSRALESLGFSMEHLVLEATRHNLGTCWISGTFDRRRLLAQISLGDEEHVAAVVPVGYPRVTKGHDVLKLVIGSRNRKAVHEVFFADVWGGHVQGRFERQPKLARIAESVRWAPSAVNRQPWRFVLTETDAVLCSVRRDCGLDMGIAMAHWAIAAHEEGLVGEWDLSLDQESVRKKLRIPSNVEIVAGFPLQM